MIMNYGRLIGSISLIVAIFVAIFFIMYSIFNFLPAIDLISNTIQWFSVIIPWVFEFAIILGLTFISYKTLIKKQTMTKNLYIAFVVLLIAFALFLFSNFIVIQSFLRL